jgi:ribosomal protein S18 acetylase RimI-like enzyme
MIDPAQAALRFDAAFAAHAPAGLRLRLRPEQDEDAAFLQALFLASFPLRDVLAEPVLTQQIELRLAAFRDGFAAAMRRIVIGPDGPIGRIIVDWRHSAGPLCVDIAVRPTDGGRGVGTALLRAWIDVAESHGLACALTVAPDNLARALYARLGFQESPSELGDFGVAMTRPPRP